MMKVLFYNLSGVENLKKDFCTVDFSVLVVGYNKNSPRFLTKEYYKYLRFFRLLSKKSDIEIIFCFYIFYNDRTYLNALNIRAGKIENIFGENFSNKTLFLNFEKKDIAFLFYFDLYKKKYRNFLENFDLIVGIDDEKFFCDNDVVFLDNNFFNKLILVNYDMQIKTKKNKTLSQNISKSYVLF